MKILAVSKKGNMFKIDVNGTPTWFFLSDAVQKFAESTNIGKDSDVTYEATKDPAGGAETIVKITKAEGSPDATNSGYSKPYKNSDSSLSTGEQIKRLSVCRATAQAIVALSGQVDQNSIISTMDSIYDALMKKVNE